MKKLLAVISALALISTPALAWRGSSYGRVHYSGSTHTSSHGGHYAGGSGSSHRGGHYVNARTGNHYGCHRC